MDWAEYQILAADRFSSLGLRTEIEARVAGARGVHNVDVYATGVYSGVPFKWVIECKAWKTSIPKEKVMALYAIVQDVGADRGFLLSEVGFQSGAVLAAQSTNITLTSIADLSLSAQKVSADAVIGARSWAAQKAKTRLLELKKLSDAHEYNSDRLMLTGELFVLDLLLQEAAEGKYPIFYPTKRLEFSNLEQLTRYADSIIDQANRWNLPS